MRLRYERDAAGKLRERFGHDDLPDHVLEELPEEIVPELLATQAVARVAVRIGTGVHIVPVNHHVDTDGSVVFRTAPGRKLDIAQRGAPMAMLETDHALDRLPGWFVTVLGQLTPVLDLTEVARLERTGLRTFADADAARRGSWLRLRPTVGRAFRVTDAATASPMRPGPIRTPAEPPKPGRGRLEELTEAECHAVLAEGHIGRLARLAGTEPRLAPVVYDATDGVLVIRSVLANDGGEIDPREVVVFEADIVDEDGWSGRSVVAEGTLDRLALRTGASPAAEAGDRSFPIPEHELLRLTIRSMTGRRIVRDD